MKNGQSKQKILKFLTDIFVMFIISLLFLCKKKKRKQKTKNKNKQNGLINLTDLFRFYHQIFDKFYVLIDEVQQWLEDFDIA